MERLTDPFQGSPYLVDEILNAVQYMCSMNLSRYAKRNARENADPGKYYRGMYHGTEEKDTYYIQIKP